MVIDDAQRLNKMCMHKPADHYVVANTVNLMVVPGFLLLYPGFHISNHKRLRHLSQVILWLHLHQCLMLI